jgi:hypothetical protein
MPPLFGTSRTRMINATSTSQYLFPTATGSSQEKPSAMATQSLFPTATGSSQEKTDATATQNLSGSNTPTPLASVVAGLGIQPDVTWSHVFFWAAVTEMVLGFLWIEH